MKVLSYAVPRSGLADMQSSMMLPAAVGAAILAIMLVGCGKRQGDRGTLYPAEGQVFLNQEPLAGALVVLYPKGESGANSTPSRAQTGPDGRFRVGTLAPGDGAPEGEYAVTVIRYPMQKQSDGGYAAGANDLPKKYTNPTTTDLRVQVSEGKSSLPALVLRTPKGNSKVPNSISFE